MDYSLLPLVSFLLVSSGGCYPFGPCGHIFNTSETGNITSPNYPNSYPLNQQCEWVVTVPDGKGIIVELLYFYTDSRGHGDGDVLQCFETQPGSIESAKRPPLEFVGYKNSGTTFSTPHNKLWFLFQSDGENMGGRGFYLQYHAYNPNECPDPGPLLNGRRTYPQSYSVGQEVAFSCDPGYVLSHGDSSMKCLNDGVDSHPHWLGNKPFCSVRCLADRRSPGRRLIYRVPSEVSTVLSPKFPSSYEEGELCTWEINSGSGQLINITMNFFDLRPGQGTFLEVWDGTWNQVLNHNVPLLGNFTGDSFPSYIVSSSSSVALKFKSGPMEPKQHHMGGFKLMYSKISDVRMDSNECSKPPLSGNMYYLPVKNVYNSGDKVQYYCNDGFYFKGRERANDTNVCIGHGAKHWSVQQLKNLPTCAAMCRYYNETSGSLLTIVLTKSTGIIYNTGYPEKLKAGWCGYSIALNHGQTVSIHFQLLELVPGVVITLYESDALGKQGDQLIKLSAGNQREFIESNKNIVNIIVNKTGNEQGGRFILKYQSITENRCNAPPTILHGYKIGQNKMFPVGSIVSYECDRFFHLVGDRTLQCQGRRSSNEWSSAAPYCVGACGGMYRANSGSVVSPNYPHNFSSNSECVWNITAQSPHYYFTIAVSKLFLSPSDQLVLQYIGNNGLATADIGSQCPNSECSLAFVSYETFIVQFKSGERVGSTNGLFELTFEKAGSCSVPDSPPNGFVVGSDFHESSQITYQCHPPYDLVGGSRNALCKRGPDGTLSWSHPPPSCVVRDCSTVDSRPFVRMAGHGAVTNLGYPNDTVKGLQDCKWHIQAVNGGAIILHFKYFDFRHDVNTYVEIYEGSDSANDKKFIAKFLPGNTVHNITSTRPDVTVHYKSPNQDVHGFKGFYLEYGELIKPPTSLPVSTTASAIWSSSKTPVVTTTIPSTTGLPPNISLVSTSSTTATVPSVSTVGLSTAEITSHTTMFHSTRHTSGSPSSTPSLSTSMKTPSTSTTPPHGRSTPSTPKLPVVIPSQQPSPSIANTSGVSESSSQDNGVNGGVISAAVIVPVVAVVLGIVGFVLWYRKKYPVRMTFRRSFGKFSNPAYDNQKSKLSHSLSLVRDPNSPLPNFSPESNGSVPTNNGYANGTGGHTNDAFTFDFETEINCNGDSFSHKNGDTKSVA